MRRFDLANLAGIDADGVTGFAHRQRHDVVALEPCEMHRLAGRTVDRFEVGLCTARQIDLKARMRQCDDARAEGVQTAPGNLRGEPALDERCQQMVAGRDIEAGAGREFGQCRFTAGFGDGFEQEQRAVDRLDAVAVAIGGAARRARFGRLCRQDGDGHFCFLPAPKEVGWHF